MKTTHTPLPWVIARGACQWPSIQSKDCSDGGGIIARVNPLRSAGICAEADLELIVRAVNSQGELLDALKLAESELTKLWRSLYATEEPTPESSLGRLLSEARAAIAKAEGTA